MTAMIARHMTSDHSPHGSEVLGAALRPPEDHPPLGRHPCFAEWVASHVTRRSRPRMAPPSMALPPSPLPCSPRQERSSARPSRRQDGMRLHGPRIGCCMPTARNTDATKARCAPLCGAFPVARRSSPTPTAFREAALPEQRARQSTNDMEHKLKAEPDAQAKAIRVCAHRRHAALAPRARAVHDRVERWQHCRGGLLGVGRVAGGPVGPNLAAASPPHPGR